jgi:hypothetical protein
MISQKVSHPQTKELALWLIQRQRMAKRCRAAIGLISRAFFGWLYIVLLSGKRAVSKGAGQEGWERIGVGKVHWSAFYHAESEMDNLLLR